VIVTELIELGARRLVRVGTCGGLDAGLEPGQLVVVGEALSDDGTSQALGGYAPLEPVAAPGTLADALLTDGGQRATVVSTDLFYDAGDRVPGWVAAGARAVEMETATVFTVAARRGVEAGCVLLVSNVVGDPAYIDADALHAAELQLGERAITAFVTG